MTTQQQARARRRKAARHNHRTPENRARVAYLYKFTALSEVEKCKATLKDDQHIVHKRWYKKLGANARMTNVLIAITEQGLMPFDEVEVHYGHRPE